VSSRNVFFIPIKFYFCTFDMVTSNHSTLKFCITKITPLISQDNELKNRSISELSTLA